LTRQPTQARYTRLSNIPGGVEVSMDFKTAFAAKESRTFAVPFVGMLTVRTLLRGVSGIYKKNMFSDSFGFISDKLFKLVERPTIKLAVELLSSSLLNSNLAQILKSKYSIFRIHNLLGYAMVHISPKPSFLTRQTLKLAFGGFGAFGLQFLAKIGITSTPVLRLLGVKEPVIRADSNIHYSSINSQNIKICDFFRIAMLQRYMQIEHLISAIIRDCRRFDRPA
jgi:hypothetical protein